MLLIKSCPRCSGDMVRMDDVDGPVVSCVQCGFVRYADIEDAKAEIAAMALPSVVPSQPVIVRSERTRPRRSAPRVRTSSRAPRAA